MAIINGTSGNDAISGTFSGDIIHGKGGNDTIHGRGKADTIFGDGGTDVLYGDGGDDSLFGGAGRDILTGGAGADGFGYLELSDSQGTAVDLITDFDISEGDRVSLLLLPPATHQASFNPSFDGVQAVFIYNPATNVTTLSYYDGSSTPVFELKFTGNVHYDRDAFLGISPSSSPTEGDDDVFGTPNADNFNLLGGDDLFIGNEGNDLVSGGSGNDRLEGDEGNDDLRGGSGDDLIAGGSGDDFISGQTGDDVLRGDRGNDTLNGNRGHDTVDANETFGDYSITKNADGSITLTDINASDEIDQGTDTLINVEVIRFTDGTYIIATGTFTPFDSII